MQDLAAPQLAGALAALVAGESVSRPSISAAYEPSQAVCDAIEALEEEREQLYDLQMQADIAAPLSVDLRLSGGPLTQHLSPKTCIHVFLSERRGAQKTSSFQSLHIHHEKNCVLLVAPVPHRDVCRRYGVLSDMLL